MERMTGDEESNHSARILKVTTGPELPPATTQTLKHFISFLTVPMIQANRGHGGRGSSKLQKIHEIHKTCPALTFTASIFPLGT